MERLHVRRALGAATLALGLWLVPVAAQAQGSIVVRPGDTLSAIARRGGTTVAALVAANGLASPDMIFAGQRLVTGGSFQPPAAQPLAAQPPAASTAYVVRPGETLYHIAVRFGTTIGTLVATNHLTSANVIYAGQRLVVPGPTGVGGPDVANPAVGGGGGGGFGRHILVDLSSQTLTAYSGSTVVATFPISSGRSWTPTPIGRFQIYSRYASQRMVGPGYDLPGVPYVQYFVGNYALHGAYWHNLFGTPTSHGCVNLRVGDAAWLWRWAGIGTEVVVQY